jgi:hypothetical protein
MKPAKVAPVTDSTVMTLAEVASWLQVKPRQVSRMGVPVLRLGAKTLRYMRGDVLAWLTSQRGAS